MECQYGDSFRRRNANSGLSIIGSTEHGHLKQVLEFIYANRGGNMWRPTIRHGIRVSHGCERGRIHRDDPAKNSRITGLRLKTGALLGGASQEDAGNLYAFGINIGLAFQLQDDLLDVYGDTATFGKNIGGDIFATRKHSY